MGKFIVVEGGDGAGKTTLLKDLEKSGALENVVFTREPGGTKFAEEMRNLVLSDEGGKTSPLSQLLAICSARTDHVERLIKPALEKGQSVISDRFDASTYMYQIVHQSSLEPLFWQLRELLLEDLEPVYVILDLEPETGLARRSGRDSSNHFDDRDLAFHEQARREYLAFGEKVGAHVINTGRPYKEVREDFLKLIKSLL